MTPSRRIPPSKTILRELEARQWTAQDLAHHSGIDERVCVGLVSDLVPISEAIALGLAKAFGTTDQIWLNLERKYGGDRT